MVQPYSKRQLLAGITAGAAGFVMELLYDTNTPEVRSENPSIEDHDLGFQWCQYR